MELRDNEEELRSKLEGEKEKWDQENSINEPSITEEDIAEVVSSMTGIPLNRIEEKESARLLNMADELSHEDCRAERSCGSDLQGNPPFPVRTQGYAPSHWNLYVHGSDGCR